MVPETTHEAGSCLCPLFTGTDSPWEQVGRPADLLQHPIVPSLESLGAGVLLGRWAVLSQEAFSLYGVQCPALRP